MREAVYPVQWEVLPEEHSWPPQREVEGEPGSSLSQADALWTYFWYVYVCGHECLCAHICGGTHDSGGGAGMRVRMWVGPRLTWDVLFCLFFK